MARSRTMDELAGLLSANEAPPEIRRGRGMILSTEVMDEALAQYLARRRGDRAALEQMTGPDERA